MKNVIAIWKWSLSVVARSYFTVVLLAVLTGLWGIAAYELLGVPAESSVLMMTLALIWALAQILVACVVIGGTVAGSSVAATADESRYPLGAIWTMGRKKVIATMAFAFVGLAVIWLCASTFEWLNNHSLEVASFLTFHLQKPIHQEFLETRIFDVIEWILWAMVDGFLLSYLIVILTSGWSAARGQSGRLLAGCVYRAPFVTSVISILAFGGLATKLARWHPLVPPGFWDYTQVVVRSSIVLLLLAAGALFWTLALARLTLASRPSPK